MSYELKEGLHLESVVGPQGPDGEQVFFMLGDSNRAHFCSEIFVVEQPGQMGMVPWAKAIRNDGKVELVNLALMESVTIKRQVQPGGE